MQSKWKKSRKVRATTDLAEICMIFSTNLEKIRDESISKMYDGQDDGVVP